jgi:hypothetical protein
MFVVNHLQKQNKQNRLENAQTWIQGGQVDSRDFYECIPHVSVQKIISELDKQSSFGSIEDLLRKQSTKESSGDEKKKESPKEQLAKLSSCLKRVELESIALIASFTKKIKQMIFFYLADLTQGPEHEGNMS